MADEPSDLISANAVPELVHGMLFFRGAYRVIRNDCVLSSGQTRWTYPTETEALTAARALALANAKRMKG